MTQDTKVLDMQGISKAFPGVQALDSVDLQLRAGEVMALVGENGAGKSTLLKILAGAQRPDEGQIYVNGELVNIPSPARSQELNIAVIYQELNLAGHLSVAENIFVGREPSTRFGLVDFGKMYRGAQKLLSDTLRNASIEPRTEVRQLNVAHKQMVEIAKALSLEAEIIVMDEPTSALTKDEIDSLLDLVSRLREQGVAVIYTSHHLDEVLRVSDRITVLRDGQLVGVKETPQTNQEEIVGMMVGRQLEELFGRGAKESRSGETALELRELSRIGQFRGISLQVQAGEILGIAGLVGAGRTEMARAVFGADPLDDGEVLVDGRTVRINSPSQAIGAGIGYMPEDRKLQGLFSEMCLRENLSAASLERVTKNGFISAREDRATAVHSVEQLSISSSSIEQKVRDLSGGNQQKVVLGKWLMVGPRILILDEPTRGVDVGGKAEIYELIRDLARQEIAIIMISSELPEIMGLSDRIIVMREGEMVGELYGEDASEEEIMALATGASQGQEVG